MKINRTQVITKVKELKDSGIEIIKIKHSCPITRDNFKQSMGIDLEYDSNIEKGIYELVTK